MNIPTLVAAWTFVAIGFKLLLLAKCFVDSSHHFSIVLLALSGRHVGNNMHVHLQLS